MNADQVGGIVRAILTALGTIVVAKGWTDGATFTMISGAVVTLATTAWSVYSNRSGKVIL